jgi:hypothetical protein
VLERCEQRLDDVMFPTLRPRDGLRVRFTALGKNS